MANPARNLWDELERQVQQWIKDIERRLNPQPERVPVPIPVQSPRRDPDRSR